MCWTRTFKGNMAVTCHFKILDYFAFACLLSVCVSVCVCLSVCWVGGCVPWASFILMLQCISGYIIRHQNESMWRSVGVYFWSVASAECPRVELCGSHYFSIHSLNSRVWLLAMKTVSIAKTTSLSLLNLVQNKHKKHRIFIKIYSIYIL